MFSLSKQNKKTVAVDVVKNPSLFKYFVKRDRAENETAIKDSSVSIRETPDAMSEKPSMARTDKHTDMLRMRVG